MTVKPISELETRYYLRMTVADRPGVLTQITRILGELLISISSVIQKGVDESAQSAEIVKYPSCPGTGDAAGDKPDAGCG